MTWEELENKHEKEVNLYIIGHKKSLDALYESNFNIIMTHGGSLSKVPDPVRQMMDQNYDSWREEWGIDGTRRTALKERQRKEILKYQKEHNIKMTLTERDDWQKRRDRGR